MSICETMKMVKQYWPEQHYLHISRYKIQCSGVAVIYARKWGVHLPWVYVHSSLRETYFV